VDVDLDALGAQYREAKASVPAHLKVQADAELARVAWLKAHRGVPSDVLYDRDTGEPLDPELRALEAAIVQAESDVAWCRGLVVACGEAIKGRPFEEVVAAQQPLLTRSEVLARTER
jgi:hypothetical protein